MHHAAILNVGAYSDGDRVTVSAHHRGVPHAASRADPDLPVVVGNEVSVGHRVVLHGCTVEDVCLIGMGAVVLNGAHIGTGTIIAAGAVVLEGAVIPPNSLVAGVPGKVRRETTVEEREGIIDNAITYRALTAEHSAIDK